MSGRSIRATTPVLTEGPAIDALNNSASTVVSGLTKALSSQLRDALNAYLNTARTDG
ncbi:hypothetical protein [Mycobacterium uberis]|uniref:hypothetical protein n=1 Tax=Mycobacterium uberis TaxID=2162698 RepID=UPI001FB4DC37|nr:hypothetical protein [Mycobacterium uberis]